MNNHYDIHSWSKLYREERLEEARVRHLVERTRTGREQTWLRRVGLAWSEALPRFFRSARLSEQ